MQNYTEIDLRLDYKRDTGVSININNLKPFDVYGNNKFSCDECRHLNDVETVTQLDPSEIDGIKNFKDYIQYLEENLIKYRNEERQIADLNNKIADAIHEENEHCNCGECLSDKL